MEIIPATAFYSAFLNPKVNFLSQKTQKTCFILLVYFLHEVILLFHLNNLLLIWSYQVKTIAPF